MLSFHRPCTVAHELRDYQVSVVGFYGDVDESLTNKEYIRYGVEKVAMRFNNLSFKTQHSFCDINQELYPNLSRLAHDGCLYLIGHGGINEYDEPTFADLEADHVAELLFEDCELATAKSITFISCNLGMTPFLVKFKAAAYNLYLNSKPKPLFFAYNRPIKMSIDGSVWVDQGEELGFESAEKFKVSL